MLFQLSIINCGRYSYTPNSFNQLLLPSNDCVHIYYEEGGQSLHTSFLWEVPPPISLAMSCHGKSFPPLPKGTDLLLICNQQMIHKFTVFVLACNVERGHYSSCDVHCRWTRLTCSCYYKSDGLPYTLAVVSQVRTLWQVHNHACRQHTAQLG